MLNLTCRIAAVILVIFASQSIAPMGLALEYPPTATGGWGFDFTGANFAKKPGDDFFRYANGGWYDRAVIPADRSSIRPSILLRITSQARIRELLEQACEGGYQSLQTDASTSGYLYEPFLDESQ